MKTKTKVYTLFLAGLVAIQYTPLLSQVRAEERLISPSPKPSMPAKVNPNKGPVKDVEKQRTLQALERNNPSPSPSESPKPTESTSPAPVPLPVAETPSRKQLIEKTALIEHAKRLSKEYVRIVDAYGKAGTKSDGIPQETPQVLRKFIQNTLLNLDGLQKAYDAVRMKLAEITFRLNFPEVTPGSILLGSGNEHIVILTDGRVVGVSQNEWAAEDPSTWTTFTPGSITVIDPSNSLYPNDDRLSLFMIRDPKVDRYRYEQHFMIDRRPIWEPVLRRYGSKKEPSE